MPADSSLHASLGLVLLAVLPWAAFVDLRTRRIPNALTAGAAVLLVTMRLALAPGSLTAALACAALVAVPLAALALAVPDGMGMGDAKLVAVLGLALGPGVIVALLVGTGAATVVGVVAVVRDGAAAARRTTVPLAPFLAAGAALAWLAGWP